MRDFSSGFKEILALETLSLIYLLELTLKSGEKYYYTDAQETLIFGNIAYRADAGIQVSAVRDTMAAFNQTASIEIGYRPDLITEEIVRKGGLDGALHHLKIIDYRRLELGAVDLFSGYVDRVTASNPYSATVDLTGWQTQSVETNGVYSLKCRNVFCDKNCGLNIENYSYPFVVGGNPGENIPDPLTIGTGIFVEDAFFQYGSILWTKGRNSGNMTGIAYSADGMMALTTDPPYIPQGGDEGIARAGCDFYAETCEKHYNNLKNLEAEPAVPHGTETSAGKTEESVVQDPAIPPPKRPDAVYSASTSFPSFGG